MIVDIIKNKERLQNKGCERYQYYSGKEKEKPEYSRERCKNLPVHEKQRLVEY